MAHAMVFTEGDLSGDVLSDAQTCLRPGGGVFRIRQRRTVRPGGRQRFAEVEPYDFHPGNFLPGRCARTVFAKATALVAAKQRGAFDIVFRRS